MPNWKKVIVSGSDAILNSIEVTTTGSFMDGGIYLTSSDTTNSEIYVAGNITASGDIVAQGNIIAENYIVSSSLTYMTQSFSDGSTIFGDDYNLDTHQFTGSLFITGITYDDTPQPAAAVLVIDTASGQLYYTGSYGVGGTGEDDDWHIDSVNSRLTSSLSIFVKRQITASGDISSSNALKASRYWVKDRKVISFSEADDVASVGYVGGTELVGPITASNIFSSSAEIHAKVPEDVLGSYNNVVVYDQGTGRFFHTGSYGGGSSVAGTNTQVQINNNGSLDAGSNLTFGKTDGNLRVGISEPQSVAAGYGKQSGSHFLEDNDALITNARLPKWSTDVQYSENYILVGFGGGGATDPATGNSYGTLNVENSLGAGAAPNNASPILSGLSQQGYLGTLTSKTINGELKIGGVYANYRTGYGWAVYANQFVQVPGSPGIAIRGGGIELYSSESYIADSDGSGSLLSPRASASAVFTLADDSSSLAVQVGERDLREVMFISRSGDNPRIGIGTATPKATFDFRDAEDTTTGTEILLRSGRTTQGALTGDEGGSINFVIDSGSYGDTLKTSGSLAKIKTIVKSATDTGASGKLVIETSKDTTSPPIDVMAMGYTEGGLTGFGTVFTSSMMLKGFNTQLPAEFIIKDSSDNTQFHINKGNITASGDISSSGTITANEYVGLPSGLVSESAQILTDAGANQILASNSDATAITSSGILFRASDSSIGIGVANTSDIDARLHIVGTGTANNREVLFKVNNSDDHDRIQFIDEGDNLPSGLKIDLPTYGMGLYANNGPIRLFSGGTGSADTILRANSNNVEISGSLDVTGQLSINGFSDVSASLAAAVAGGDNLGNHTATQDLDLANFDITNATSASIDHLAVNDKLQGNGPGFQFFSYNEDTVKTKFANWYSTNDHQYGMGMLWYETWFGALEDTDLGNDRARRIGFYLETPNSGSTDSVSGITGAHPTNARAYVDVNGMYISGTLSNTGSINSSGNITTTQTGSFGRIEIDDTIQATNFTGSFMRLDQNGSGFRMTNRGAFDADGTDFRIFATNTNLKLATNGSSGTRLTLNSNSASFETPIKSQGNFVVSRSSAFTDNEFLVADGTGGVVSTDALAVDNGNLGIGTSSPTVRLHMVGQDFQTSQFLMEQYNNTQDAPDIRTRRYRTASNGDPADVIAGDYLFRLNVHGQDGGASALYGSMRFDVDDSNQDALEWAISTRDTNSNTEDRITIDKDGDVIISGSLSANIINGGTF